MTPEERAARVKIRVDYSGDPDEAGQDNGSGVDREPNPPTLRNIAAAIRDAVAAERERCAQIAERWVTSEIVDEKGFAQRDPFAALIARHIREDT